MKTEDLKEMLWVELSNMKQDKKIRRFEVTFNSSTNKFDIWLEWLDGHACTLDDILTVQDLKSELAKSLPVKKSWKCHVCRYYLKNCDGCKKGFYNSMFIPCPDWKGPEYQPTDKDLCDAFDALIVESKQMTSPIVHVHKGTDWLMTYILNLVGYDLSLYNKTPKGYEEDPDNYCDTFAPIVFWQCILCRRYDNRNLRCLDGLDEGWVHENHCPSFIHVEEPINQKFFKYMMNLIYNEKAENEAELSWEAMHFNMDRFMSYVIESLGYFKFAKKYRDLELEYLEVPF